MNKILIFTGYVYLRLKYLSLTDYGPVVHRDDRLPGVLEENHQQEVDFTNEGTHTYKISW